MNRKTRRKRLQDIQMTINVLEGKRKAVNWQLSEVMVTNQISASEAPTHKLTESLYAQAKDIAEKVVFQTQTRAKILSETDMKMRTHRGQ